MAIAAIDAEAADVVLMAEGDRLRRRVNAGAGVVVRARESDDGGCADANDGCPTGKKLRIQVSAAGEKIWVIPPRPRRALTSTALSELRSTSEQISRARRCDR